MEQLLDRLAILIVRILCWSREQFARLLQMSYTRLTVWQRRMLFTACIAGFIAWLCCSNKPMSLPAAIVPAGHLPLHHKPLRAIVLRRLDSLRLHDTATYGLFLRKYPGLADTLARLKF